MTCLGRDTVLSSNFTENFFDKNKAFYAGEIGHEAANIKISFESNSQTNITEFESNNDNTALILQNVANSDLRKGRLIVSCRSRKTSNFRFFCGQKYNYQTFTKQRR